MKLSSTVSLVLGVGLTVASLWYVRPSTCERVCDEPEQVPCPSGACRIGEQSTGFPLPVIVDGGGSSPTSGWGKIGPEDWPNPFTFLVDVVVYGCLLWFLWHVLLVVRRKEPPSALLSRAPLFAVALVILMIGVFRF